MNDEEEQKAVNMDKLTLSDLYPTFILFSNFNYFILFIFIYVDFAFCLFILLMNLSPFVHIILIAVV